MYKKFSVLILALTLVLSACSTPVAKLTPKETLDKIQAKSLELDAYAFEMTGTMDTNVEGAEDNAEATQALEMMKNIQMDMDGTFTGMKSGEYATNMNFNVDMNGLGVKAGVYLDTKEIIVDYPMLGKLVVVKFDELMDMVKQYAPEEEAEKLDTELINKVTKDIKDVFIPKLTEYSLKNIPEDSLELIDEYAFKYKEEEEVKMPALKMTLNAEQYQKMTLGLIDDLTNDEEIYNTIKAYEIPDFPATFEEYQADLKEATESEEFKKAFNQADEGADMNVVSIYGYDKDYLVQVGEMTSSTTVKEEEQEITVSVSQNFAFKMNYKDVKAEKPEVTEENSMGLEELMMMFMGGM